MRIEQLTRHDLNRWADLLALCFKRQPHEMSDLLMWLHRFGIVVAWGAWDKHQLVAQYMCLLRPFTSDDHRFQAGVSINMAVHPTYRGQGLVKQVAQPVYQSVYKYGGVLGLGFSNAEGVQVDRRSKGYGYQVVGQMQPIIGILPNLPHADMHLTPTFPELASFSRDCVNSDGMGFLKTPQLLHTRYALHPFRRYSYGVLKIADQVQGIVVYRNFMIAGVEGVALLDAWGTDLANLLNQWSGAMRQSGTRFVQLLTTPHHPLKTALSQMMQLIPQPYTRTPYYLTVKPLTDTPLEGILDFEQWQFLGGDIL